MEHHIDKIQGQPGSVDSIVHYVLHRLKSMKIVLFQDLRMGSFEEWAFILTVFYQHWDSINNNKTSPFSRCLYRIVVDLLLHHLTTTLLSFMMWTNLWKTDSKLQKEETSRLMHNWKENNHKIRVHSTGRRPKIAKTLRMILTAHSPKKRWRANLKRRKRAKRCPSEQERRS